MDPVLRAKFKVDEIKSLTNHDIICMTAVSKNEDTSAPCDPENEAYAKIIASASLTMDIRDHSLCEKFEVGEEYYVDFIPVLGSQP